MRPRRMRRSVKARLILPLMLLLNACVPASHSEVATRAVIADSTLPPMKQFTQARPAQPHVSNAALAEDFLDLSFRMESGRALPVLTRFEGPITLRVLGQRTSQGAAWRRSLWASSHQCGAAANGTSHQPVAARLHMPSPTTSSTNNNTTTTTLSRSFTSCSPRPRTPSFLYPPRHTSRSHCFPHPLSLARTVCTDSVLCSL